MHFRKPAIDEWPWRSLKVIGIAIIRYVIYHFILPVRSRDVKFVFFQHLKFVGKYSNFIRSSKMAATAGRRRTTAAASPTSLDHPAGGPRQTKRQSPTGVSPPPHPKRRQQQASNNWLKRPRPSPNDCITLCGILSCGRGARPAVGGLKGTHRGWDYC